MEDFDINAEYIKVYGESQRPTLYAPNDYAYGVLRKMIINAPNIGSKTDKLPFEDLSNIPLTKEYNLRTNHLDLENKEYVYEKISQIIGSLQYKFYALIQNLR